MMDGSEKMATGRGAGGAPPPRKGMTVGRKIALGFALLIALVLVQGAVSLSNVQKTSVIVKKVHKVRVPLAQSAADLSKAIQTTLAALRGWMLLGNPEFKERRKGAWESIDANLQRLQELLKSSNDQDSRAALADIQGNFADFRVIQEEIERLAHTVENEPAKLMMQNEVAPLAATIDKAIITTLHRESRRASNDIIEVKQSKSLLKTMSDFSNTFSATLSAIQTFLLTGKDEDARAIHNAWTKNTLKFNVLQRADLHPDDREHFQAMAAARQAFEPKIAVLVELRSGLKWNLAIWQLGNKAIPVAKELEKDIDALAVLQEKRMLADIQGLNDTLSASRNSTLGILAAVFVVGLFAAWTITRLITLPLFRIGDVIKDMAHGNLTTRISVKPRGDEVNIIGHDVNTMANELARIIRTVIVQSEGISACARMLSQVKETISSDSDSVNEVMGRMIAESQKMEEAIALIHRSIREASDNIEETFQNIYRLTDNINTNAAAAEESSQNVSTMASAAEEMTANIQDVNQNLASVNESVNTVASAVEEMTASFSEIQDRCQSASAQSQRAHKNAADSANVMKRLLDSANEISTVVNIINNIADQTNMLALNAAIEAAGAGDAGRGFAVVAEEVKELARQTTDATKVIAGKVREIQNNAKAATSASQEIVELVKDINQVNLEITQAVDEQTRTTSEIARSIQEVAQAAQSVTHNAQELSQGATEVSRAAMEAANGTTEIARSTTEMTGFIKGVSEKVATAQKFIISIIQSAENTQAAFGARDIAGAFRLVRFIHGSVNQLVNLTQVVEGTSHSLHEAEEGLHVGDAPFDVGVLKESLLEFVGHLEHAMTGRQSMTPEQAADPAACSFGQWCLGSGADALRHHAVFQEIAAVHAELHQKASQAVTMAKEERKEEARTLLDQVQLKRRAIFALLDRLYQEAGCAGAAGGETAPAPPASQEAKVV